MTDRIGLGVLTRLVPRELVDEVVAGLGKKEARLRLLPSRVVVYFVLALALFYGDSYEEVMRKLVQGLNWLGVWRRDWKVPTTSALSQARRRLGYEPMAELFERVAVPCAMRSTAGAWKRQLRLMSIDGVGLDAPDTADNVGYFGYHGVKKDTKSAFAKVGVMALAECGTHAIVAVEVGRDGDDEHRLGVRLVASSAALAPGMLVMADRGLYSYEILSAITGTGAHACLRAPSQLELPVLRWFPDGSYLSFVAEPAAKLSHRYLRKKGKISLTDLPGMYVRVVDYEVGNRGRDAEGELITLITDITDHEELSSVDLAEAYHERWEIELTFDEIETHQRGAHVILRSKTPDMVLQELYGLLITHYGIRQLMTEAADQADIDPDRLSFTRSLNIIRRQITSQAGFSPSDT